MLGKIMKSEPQNQVKIKKANLKVRQKSKIQTSVMYYFEFSKINIGTKFWISTIKKKNIKEIVSFKMRLKWSIKTAVRGDSFIKWTHMAVFISLCA